MDRFEATLFHTSSDPVVTVSDQEWFRATLKKLGLTQTGLMRMMRTFGDDRKPGAILRGIQRMYHGEHRVSGEMRVILNLALTHLEDNTRPKHTPPLFDERV